MNNKDKHLKFIFACLFNVFVICGCSIRPKSSDYGYLNNYYVLTYCGDIHNGGIYDQEVLNRYNNFIDYSYLFSKEKTYMNYQCIGTSYDDFRCVGSISIETIDGDILLKNDAFDCWTDVGLYTGEIIFLNEDDKNQIGRIYVYSPYWCRIQLKLDLLKNNEEKLITFEFWKGTFNNLPDFVERGE